MQASRKQKSRQTTKPASKQASKQNTHTHIHTTTHTCTTPGRGAALFCIVCTCQGDGPDTPRLRRCTETPVNRPLTIGLKSTFMPRVAAPQSLDSSTRQAWTGCSSLRLPYIRLPSGSTSACSCVARMVVLVVKRKSKLIWLGSLRTTN